MNPVVAGLDSDNKPYICDMDLIGNINQTIDFAVGGSSSEQVQGMCETLWEPDLVIHF